LITALTLMALDGPKALIKISLCLFNYELPSNIRERS